MEDKVVANPTGLMDEEQAAEYLGISKSTLGRMRKRGDIDYTPIGMSDSLVRYTVSQLDAYIERKATRATEE